MEKPNDDEFVSAPNCRSNYSLFDHWRYPRNPRRTPGWKDFYYALYGGYPKIVLTSELDRKEKYLQQIIDTYVRKDIRDLAEIKDVSRFNRLLEVLASQSGDLLNITELV